MAEQPDAVVLALVRLVRAARETDRRERVERRAKLTIVKRRGGPRDRHQFDENH